LLPLLLQCLPQHDQQQQHQPVRGLRSGPLQGSAVQCLQLRQPLTGPPLPLRLRRLALLHRQPLSQLLHLPLALPLPPLLLLLLLPLPQPLPWRPPAL